MAAHLVGIAFVFVAIFWMVWVVIKNFRAGMNDDHFST